MGGILCCFQVVVYIGLFTGNVRVPLLYNLELSVFKVFSTLVDMQLLTQTDGSIEEVWK